MGILMNKSLDLLRWAVCLSPGHENCHCFFLDGFKDLC